VHLGLVLLGRFGCHLSDIWMCVLVWVSASTVRERDGCQSFPTLFTFPSG
jgi:hypothetical protein